MQSFFSRPLSHLSIDALRSLREDLSLQISRDTAVIHRRAGNLLSKENERDALDRHREDLNMQINKQEEDIHQLSRVVLSKEEERDDLDKEILIALDEQKHSKERPVGVADIALQLSQWPV